MYLRKFGRCKTFSRPHINNSIVSAAAIGARSHLQRVNFAVMGTTATADLEVLLHIEPIRFRLAQDKEIRLSEARIR